MIIFSKKGIAWMIIIRQNSATSLVDHDCSFGLF